MKIRIVVPILFLGVFAKTAAAQEYRLGVGAGYFDFTQASNSSKAVLGSSGGFNFGADFSAGKTVFVGVGGRYFKKNGERVFVASPTSTVFPLLNEPLSVRVIPIEGTVGYRFGGERSSFRPYAGLGPGLALYHEESTVGGVASSLDETKFQAHAMAGFEFGKGDVRLGLEVNYSIVPSALGVGGVSKVYNEKDIGGLTILGRLVFTSPHH